MSRDILPQNIDLQMGTNRKRERFTRLVVAPNVETSRIFKGRSTEGYFLGIRRGYIPQGPGNGTLHCQNSILLVGKTDTTMHRSKIAHNIGGSLSISKEIPFLA